MGSLRTKAVVSQHHLLSAWLVVDHPRLVLSASRFTLRSAKWNSGRALAGRGHTLPSGVLSCLLLLDVVVVAGVSVEVPALGAS